MGIPTALRLAPFTTSMNGINSEQGELKKLVTNQNIFYRPNFISIRLSPPIILQKSGHSVNIMSTIQIISKVM